MADPGFSQGGGHQSFGAPTYDFAKFLRKLNEIERICTRGHPLRPLRSANEYDIEFSVLTVWSRQIILISVDLPLVIRVHFEFVQTRSRVRVKPMFEMYVNQKDSAALLPVKR